MDVNYLSYGQGQVNVSSPLYTFSQGLQCISDTEKVKTAQSLLPESHLTHAMPAITKEIPILIPILMLWTLIASLPPGTETEI